MIEVLRPSMFMVVDEPTRVGEARRRAAVLADRMEFDETYRGRVALVVAEAATNLVKHAGGGELIVQGRRDPGAGTRLDVLAMDRGPGMVDVGRCMADGYSTTGSMGTGLGAIARLSDGFGIHSTPGEGTVVWSCFRPGRWPAAGRASSADLGSVSVAVHGEESCGDEWAALGRDGRDFLLVVDGLGHGPAAAEAAGAAVEAFRSCEADEPADIVDAAHRALRSTRGAAMAVARLDAARGAIRYAGVGNISGVIVDARTGRNASSMVSLNGTVGHVIRKVQAFDYDWPGESLVILHSDGLTNRWGLDRYPGLVARRPGLVAGVLYRDHRRGNDDATVVVARRGGPPP